MTRLVLVVLCVVAASAACTLPGDGAGGAATAAAVPLPIVLLTGPAGGAYSPLGHALADIYNVKVAGVRVTATTTTGPEGAAANAQEVEAGQADLAFSRADIAYQAFRQPPGTSEARGSGPEPRGSHLRSIAVLYANAVHVLVRRGSGITRGAEMRGHRVQMAEEPGPAGGALARFVVEAHGLADHDVQAVASSRNGIARLKSGDLDVRIFASAYPIAGIDDVGPSSQIALLSLEPDVIDRLRSKFPFFKPVVIPKGTYPGQERDVQTVGIDGLLLCRDSLPEPVAYDLTRALFDSLPELARTQNSARMIDLVRAPATPVPLHPGAARYYRERDLFR